MKKIFTKFAPVVAIGVTALAIVGCSDGPQHIIPEIVYGGEGNVTIEALTNIDADHTIYGDRVLKHSEFVDWGSISSAWVIKVDGGMVGWIEIPSGSWQDNKDPSKYSYGIGFANSPADEFDGSRIDLYVIDEYLYGNDAEEFLKNHVAFTANVGTIEYDQTLDGGDGTTVGSYFYDLTGVKPKDTPSITITLSFHE